MSVGTISAVEKSVHVAASPERAFRVFTGELATWWPLHQYGVFGERAATVELDGRVGGRLIERAADGSETTWGEVLEWEPPSRLLLSWHPGHGPDEPSTEVELRFSPEGDGTLVELTHRAWERLGERAERSRSNYDAGWPHVLARYSDAF